MKRKHIVLIVANGVSVLFFIIMTLLASGVKNSFPDQQVIGRWTDGSERYSQISVFTEAGSAMNVNAVFTARTEIEKRLVENSLVPENENARIWTDAFSAERKMLNVSSDYGKAEINAIITGGDFFLFHPLELISGYYYSDDDLMHDRVLIDEVLAWQLYGSSDIAGKPVIIGNKYFYIAGVYRQSENSDMKKVTGETPLLFMSYQGNEFLGSDTYFTCYEACLPNPVTGLAEKIVTESLNINEEFCETVENSTRYSLKKRFEIIRNFGMRSVRDNAVVYPNWENAARISEDKSALLLVMQLLGLAVPVVTACGYIVIAYRKRKIFYGKFADAVKRIFNKIAAKIQSAKKGRVTDE